MSVHLQSNIASTHRAAHAPVAVNIDSLYVGSYIDGVGIDWERLRYEKEKLVASPGRDFSEFELGNETFALHRGARKPYTFRLSNPAFTLLLGENIEPRCYAQFRSEALWAAGLLETFERYKTMWQLVGSFETRPEVISRVDAAFDFKIGKPDFDLNHFLSKAAKDNTWRNRGDYETFQFGIGDIVCRFYDKCAEIESESHKYWFYEIWDTREGVWRAEFQLRGQCLKNAGIGTLDQLRAHLPDLVRELAQYHTSLRTPTSDSNRSRWPRHPVWNGLIAATDRLVLPPESPPPPLYNGAEYLQDRQLRSLYGHLKGLAALRSIHRPRDPLSLEQLLEWLPSALERRHSPDLWNADVKAKILKRGLGL